MFLYLNNQIDINISIYNSSGNKIKHAKFPNYNGTKQSIKFDFKGLPAGLYYYEVSAGSIHQFKKMVLQK